MENLERDINNFWENRANLSEGEKQELKGLVNKVINLLDSGKIRVSELKNDVWHTNQWVKKAILLSFTVNDMKLIENAPEGSFWYDKVSSKFLDWKEDDFKQAGFRAVPGCFVRKSSYIAKSVVLMPSFVNVGAYVDEGTMIDTWVTVGSCAQIGKNCHISGGVGIGGVLEPLQAGPVIIEDDCFIGARSEIVEGVVVGKGSVISMGVYIGMSTKIINRETGEIHYGKVPPYSVVVPGSVACPKNKDLSLYCAIIVKQVDAKTRAKTSINDLLRG